MKAVQRVIGYLAPGRSRTAKKAAASIIGSDPPLCKLYRGGNPVCEYSQIQTGTEAVNEIASGGGGVQKEKGMWAD